jgi:cell division protease FtsH
MFQNKRQKDDGRESKNMPARQRLAGCNPWGTLIWILLAISIFFWFGNPLEGMLVTPPQINYSTFRQQVKTGNVERVTVQGEKIEAS